jgi:hypothetical protein
VPIGHPLGRFGVARRRPVEKVTHWGRWGERRRFATAPYEAPGADPGVDPSPDPSGGPA